jgi:hypothetical protein
MQPAYMQPRSQCTKPQAPGVFLQTFLSLSISFSFSPFSLPVKFVWWWMLLPGPPLPPPVWQQCINKASEPLHIHALSLSSLKPRDPETDITERPDSHLSNCARARALILTLTLTFTLTLNLSLTLSLTLTPPLNCSQPPCNYCSSPLLSGVLQR